MRPYGIYVTRAEGSRKWDRGRQRVRRLRRRPRRPAARPRPAGSAGGDPGGAAGRHAPGRQPRTRGALGADRARAGALRGAGALHLLRHRGDRTWLSASPAPTPARTRSCASKAHFHGWHDHMTSGYMSHFDGGADGGCSARPRLPGDSAAARRRRGGARRLRGRRRHRRGDPGADRWLLRPRASRARVSRLPAGADGEARRGADLRRGDYGLPRLPWRCAGVFRV